MRGTEHIIIFAKRDINKWEELTYDYRWGLHAFVLIITVYRVLANMLYYLLCFRFFSAGEQLSCSCGSQRCRGVVNDTEAREQATKIKIPRSELLNLIGDNR